MNAFRHLADNKFIVCITEGQGTDAELQATSNHTMLRKSFTNVEPTCLALTGFYPRATAIKLTPKDIFKHSPKIKIPKIFKLMKCTSTEEIITLPREVEKKVDHYVILLPLLAEELFEDENYSLMHVLVKMIIKVRKLIKKSAAVVIDGKTDDDNNRGEQEEVFHGVDDDDFDLDPSNPDKIEVDELTVGEVNGHPL